MAPPGDCSFGDLMKQSSRARPKAAAAPRSVTILGATGSIGSSTVDLLKRQPDRFRVAALTAHRNGVALAQLAECDYRQKAFTQIASPQHLQDRPINIQRISNLIEAIFRFIEQRFV